jgi:hypothetical protein
MSRADMISGACSKMWFHKGPFLQKGKKVSFVIHNCICSDLTLAVGNRFSHMSAANKKGFNLMDQVQPKLIIPTHIFDPTCAKIAAEKWVGYDSYKKYLSFKIHDLPEANTIIFMGRNADFVKLPYSKF